MLLNEFFFRPPQEFNTRQLATGKSPLGNGTAAPLGGIDPQHLEVSKLTIGLPLVRVAHDYRHLGGERANAYAPWWSTAKEVDALIEFAMLSKQDPVELYRAVQAVTREFGPANTVFTATLALPLLCYSGKSRPIYLYHKRRGRDAQDRYEATVYSSNKPLFSDTVKRSYDKQLPDVDQLFIPGLTKYDYPTTPGHHTQVFAKAFANLREVRIDLFVRERVTAIRHKR